MTQTPNCVGCGGAIQTVAPAAVSPFLATRIWGSRPPLVDLVRCTSCGLLFFNPRLTSDEERRIYEGYRSPEYQRQRQSSEPWYTPEFNASLESAQSYADRREALKRIIEPLCCRRILDYGGGNGLLVQGLAPETYVYDISGVTPVEGVLATDNPASVGADLIVSSNVLEHINYPRTLLQAMQTIARWVYIEVPDGSPLGWRASLKRIGQAAQVLGRCPSQLAWPLLHMNEHVNFFTSESLSAMAGDRLIGVGTHSIPTPMCWCLVEGICDPNASGDRRTSPAIGPRNYRAPRLFGAERGLGGNQRRHAPGRL